MSPPPKMMLGLGLSLPWLLAIAAVSEPLPTPQDRQKREPPKVLKAGQDCATSDCHESLTKGRYVHGPVAIKRCAICHVQPDATTHSFKPFLTGAQVCNSCHEQVLLKNVHKPVQDGNCMACHDPHHSKHRSLLKTETEKDLCNKCHEETMRLQKKFVHGPVSAGACNLCHNPHSSFYNALLNKKGTDTCLRCHDDMEAALKGNVFKHKPVGEDCSLCHNAHASDHKFQLKEESRALCLNCHKAKKEEIEAATVFHEALTSGEGCKNCHNTHASKFPKLLNMPVIDLCLSCHDKPLVRKDGKVIKALAKEIRTSKYLHGPIRQGDCSSCHNPHGSKNFRLLREEYPMKFYAPFDMKTYNLCFGCHDSKVFVVPETMTLTKFRNGDKNLHFLHVNKTTKGRTCRACHKTHASNLPKHMAELVPFGAWDIPIEFKSLPAGGSCAPGCHKPKEYNYLKAVNNEEKKR